jgi:hypothetical protein
VLPHPDFRDESRRLEAAYLESEDPMVQSGFTGGQGRWIAERSPLVDAIDRDGSFLDVGCANGLLAADVVDWASQRGFTLEPHGVDLGPGLIALARRRLPDHQDNFDIADAWTWHPGRQWTFVYSLLDLSPPELWCEWVGRLSRWVEPEGRLIMASYGRSTSRVEPVDVVKVLEGCGLRILGSSHGGEPPITRFAWSAPTR